MSPAVNYLNECQKIGKSVLRVSVNAKIHHELIVCPWHSQSRSFLEIHYSYDGNPGSIVARNDVDGQEPPLYEKEEVGMFVIEILVQKSNDGFSPEFMTHSQMKLSLLMRFQNAFEKYLIFRTISPSIGWMLRCD